MKKIPVFCFKYMNMVFRFFEDIKAFKEDAISVFVCEEGGMQNNKMEGYEF